MQYRPPNQSREDTEPLLREISRASRYKNVFIMGDFNYRNINWDNLVGDQEAQSFVSVLQDSFLKQLISEPTREENILDLLLTNRDDIVSDIVIGDALGNSDHKEVRYIIKWEEKCTLNNTLIPDFRCADFQGLRRQLGRINLTSPVLGSDPGQGTEAESQVISSKVSSEIRAMGDQYDYMIRKIQEGQQQYIPYRQVRSKGNNPRWMTDRLKKEIGIKRGLYVRIKKGETHLETRYREMARIVKKNTRRAKRNYEIKVAREAGSNPKGFFQLYKTKVKDKIGPLKTEDNVLLDTEEEMSEALNDYFLSAFTREKLDEVPQGDQIFSGEEEEILTDISISREDVVRLIDKLKATKAPGPDEIFPRVLKECRSEICEGLAKVFRKSVDAGAVPDSWRQANVVPIFKKGDRSSMQNYRPISLTSVIGKMLESLIADSIRDHIERHNLIHDSQHGFSKGRSCLTNLLAFYTRVFETADNGESYDVIYLDFSKAFDKVPHQRLLNKIKAHGIGGKVFNWIRAWISDRKQRVTINGVKSKWGNVTSGVPQGSVLGPLLFIIYINDLDNGVSSDISKFADDTKIGRPIRSADDSKMLQEDLNKLHAWSEKWQMDFNITKCSVLNVGSRNPVNSYNLDNVTIGRTECERDLGVLVSPDLKFRKQCISARSRANRVLGFIARTVTNKSAEMILKLYLVLVRHYLDYGIQFWCPSYGWI